MYICPVATEGVTIVLALTHPWYCWQWGHYELVAFAAIYILFTLLQLLSTPDILCHPIPPLFNATNVIH